MADDVVIGQPGSAEPPGVVPRLSFDPMTWEVDPPIEVILATSPDFRAGGVPGDVRRQWSSVAETMRC